MSSPTWRYRLAAGTSASSPASSLVVRARSPRNALTMRSRTGCSRTSALAMRQAYRLLAKLLTFVVMIIMASLGVVAVLAVAFAVFCLIDLVRAKEVRLLPKAIWAVIICVSLPWGGLVYLLAGRDRQAQADPATAALPAGVTAAPRPRGQVSPVEIKVEHLTKRFG